MARRSIKVIYSKVAVRENASTAIRKIFAQYRTMSRKALSSWKEYTEHVKKGEILDRMTAVKMKMKMEKIAMTKTAWVIRVV